MPENQNGELQKALRYHQNGKAEQARRLYQRILKRDPDSVDALHFYGLLNYQQGHTDRGIELVRRALKLNPYYTDAHNNLGNMLNETGEFDAARICYENSLSCNPDHLEAHNNLGVLLRYLGDLEGSRTHLESAVALAPGWAHARLNLGNTHAAMQNREEAAACYRQCIELDSELSRSNSVIGSYLSYLGYQDEARLLYENWLREEPENPVVAHMLAACTQENVPARASDAYLEDTFDRFAQSFEVQLTRLNYRAPQLIADAVQRHLGKPAASLAVLDLGCGTGFCGPLIRPFAKKLTGVDLSSGMLRKARLRGCYDRLVRKELVAFLEDSTRPYELMISADTLVYFGSLERPFQAISAHLAAGGLLVFTVECNAVSEDDYVLYPHGRYGHGADYLRRTLSAAGLELLELAACHLRTERGAPVDGWLVCARQPAT